jgi:FtsP/CotA-like multicopper oxidase with cupredoxin domain
MHVITVCLILTTSMLDGGSTAALAVQSPSDNNIAFVSPTRRPPNPTPAAPPDLPDGADDVEPLTFDMTTTHRPPKGTPSIQRQTVTRTKDRIHIATEGKEWLFERNPVDPRRVSAYLIHHHAQVVVLHEDSDLRHALGINGWADVLTLGVDPASSRRLTPRGFTVRHEGGVTAVAITHMRRGANGERLRSPASRFPAYGVLDLAEWLEGAKGRPRRQ